MLREGSTQSQKLDAGCRRLLRSRDPYSLSCNPRKVPRYPVHVTEEHKSPLPVAVLLASHSIPSVGDDSLTQCSPWSERACLEKQTRQQALGKATAWPDLSEEQ